MSGSKSPEKGREEARALSARRRLGTGQAQAPQPSAQGQEKEGDVRRPQVVQPALPPAPGPKELKMVRDEAASMPKFPKSDVLQREAWFAKVDRLVAQTQDIVGAEAADRLAFYIPESVFGESKEALGQHERLREGNYDDYVRGMKAALLDPGYRMKAGALLNLWTAPPGMTGREVLTALIELVVEATHDTGQLLGVLRVRAVMTLTQAEAAAVAAAWPGQTAIKEDESRTAFLVRQLNPLLNILSNMPEATRPTSAAPAVAAMSVQGGKPRAPFACYYCKERNHGWRDCDMEPKPACKKCNETGHPYQACPVKKPMK